MLASTVFRSPEFIGVVLRWLSKIDTLMDMKIVEFIGRKKRPDWSKAVGAGQGSGFAYVIDWLRLRSLTLSQI
jgi:hypothetical protein